MLIRANLTSQQELLDYFWNLENIVPGREERKYKERQFKKETFCIEKYLITLAHYDLLTYPLHLAQQERTQAPDFVVNEKHGIEITEATDEEYQKWLTSISGQKGPHMYSNKGYIGSEQEAIAVQKVLACVERKLLKVGGYQSSNPNISSCDLIIYENTECPLQQEEFFQRLLKENIDKGRVFGKVSVICGDTLFYGINTANAQHLAIPILVDN